MMTPELAVAEEAAKAAGAILSRFHRDGFTSRSKGIADLVTDADIEAEKAVAEVIRKHYPGHAILGEEAEKGSIDAEHLWVVDPLDGTNNFAHGIPQFCVSIGYYRSGRAECGAIFEPIGGEWFLTARSLGAFQNGKRVHVSEESSLNEIVVGVGFPYDRGALMEATLAAIGDLIRAETHGVRRFGSAALDLCHVGLGRFGAYFEYQLSPWDYAAGRLFVEEAGGRVTDARGGEVGLGKCSLLATNGRLHEAVLEILRKHHP